jgi:nitroreductase
MTLAQQIMDLARWAPSGDNTQVWRFEFLAADQVRVHGHDTAEALVVFDLDGIPSLLSMGCLIETVAQAATMHGCRVEVSWRPDPAPHRYLFDLTFIPDTAIKPSPLTAGITTRSVQRASLSRRALRSDEKQALVAAAGEFELIWLEGKQRAAAARLNYDFAGPRNTMPETFANLSAAIDPDPQARFSHDRMPAKSIPVDPLTRHLMLWALKSWPRLHAVNTLFGTALARLQLDLLPGLRCAAHIALLAPKLPCTRADHVASGRAFQRVWLTAEQLGLRLQPEYTPVEFSRHVQQGLKLTKVAAIQNRIERLADDYAKLLAPIPIERCLMLARLGEGPTAQARALRLSLADLTVLSPSSSIKGDS